VITIRTVAAAAAAVVLLAGCSSTDDTGSVADRSTTTNSSTSASSSSAPAADRATTEACRSLADDRDLAAFWRDIANTGTTTGARGMLAGAAVMKLGAYTADPAVEPAVAAVMTTAVTEMGNLNQDIAGGAQFDVDRFRNIITPVVTACEQAGVDMAVPT
jgi:outer membrane murein-binding lipoprotein Lpp